MITSPRRPRLYTYEWGTGPNFLLATIAGDAVRIQGTLTESAHEILSRIDEDCGLFAFHVSMTKTAGLPPSREPIRRALRDRGIRILNEHVVDISKRQLHRVCREASIPCAATAADGDPDEWLIVKTDLNAGGYSERRLSEAARAHFGIRLHPTISGEGSYRRLQRRDLDPAVWDAPDVVVERWITNPQDIFYRVYVVGTHVVIVKAKDPELFKTMRGALPRTAWFIECHTGKLLHGPPPLPMRVMDTLARFRASFGLDFGALDVLQDERGDSYIIDVNSTPYWGGQGHPRLAAVTGFLTAGVRTLMPEPSTSATCPDRSYTSCR